jgi:hypothetical protein
LFFLGTAIFDVPSNVVLASGRRAPLARTNHDHVGCIERRG